MIAYVFAHFVLIDLAIVFAIGRSVYNNIKVKKALNAFGKEKR